MARKPKKTDPRAWDVESLGNSVSRITFTGHTQWIYLSSDWHWDSCKCDRDQLDEDLKLAKKLDAAVCSFGDHFDCMGGKYDPRSAKHEIRPEFQVGNYFDSIIDHGAEWLVPYTEQMAVITPGNHETAIRKRQETCLTTRIVDRLRTMGSPVVQSGYAGWVLIRGKYKPKGASKSTGTGPTSVYKIWYHHGFGGGGPVTRGVIDFSRMMVDVDADAIVSGHVHQKTLMEATRQRVSAVTGKPSISPVHLIRSSTYKTDSVSDGWGVEKGMSARPVGGWWLRLRWDPKHTKINATFHDRPEAE